MGLQEKEDETTKCLHAFGTMFDLIKGFTIDFIPFAQSVIEKGGSATDMGFVVSLASIW